MSKLYLTNSIHIRGVYNIDPLPCTIYVMLLFILCVCVCVCVRACVISVVPREDISIYSKVKLPPELLYYIYIYKINH